MPKLKESYTNILNKLITDKNISEAEFRILCYLLMRAGNQDICYPSLNTISKDIDISLSTVKRAIPELVDKGYLKKINRKRKNGSSTSNLYKFTGKVYGTG
ncbi:MAG: helix-turn-helix domain-containing protein [Clostridia bacterium]|nr:helix-turn-helix domain-containing protein [Clostridia bacterium]